MDFTLIDNLSNYQDIIRQNYAVLIYFSHDDCNVCKTLKPKVKQLISKDFERVKIYYVDIYKNPEIAAQNGIFVAPTILLLFEGKEHLRISRNLGIEELKEKIQRPYEIMFK
jgi:thioredoxin-like negative regulator of GroEL